MSKTDAIEQAAEDAADDWPNLVGPLTTPIEQLVDRAGSLTGIRDGLAALAVDMDVVLIGEKLARATFGARLAGDASLGRQTAA